MLHIETGELERVLSDWCPKFAGYHLYYPSRRQPSPAFSLVLQALTRRNRKRSRGRTSECPLWRRKRYGGAWPVSDRMPDTPTEILLWWPVSRPACMPRMNDKWER